MTDTYLNHSSQLLGDKGLPRLPPITLLESSTRKEFVMLSMNGNLKRKLCFCGPYVMGFGANVLFKKILNDLFIILGVKPLNLMKRCPF
ncbi:hypothetical protein SK128_025771 [Halocaridina rubra]|uniref:Uncharacterized protein n=1 Tax=Halocaridina rubra TaxID=373956 RepID=A0AAN8XJK5_HALRR